MKSRLCVPRSPFLPIGSPCFSRNCRFNSAAPRASNGERKTGNGSINLEQIKIHYGEGKQQTIHAVEYAPVSRDKMRAVLNFRGSFQH